jgi:site-specific recombinase XerD
MQRTSAVSDAAIIAMADPAVRMRMTDFRSRSAAARAADARYVWRFAKGRDRKVVTDQQTSKRSESCKISWAASGTEGSRMLLHACGYALANKGHDTRAIQGWLGHRSITSTAIYTALVPNRFRDFWHV